MPITNLKSYFEHHRPEQCIVGTKWLLEQFQNLRPKIYLEIGCAHLDTFRLYESYLPKDGLAIGIDIKVRPNWLTYKSHSGCRVSLFEEGSDNPEVVKKVSNLLSGQKIDFLFIDGCHDYEEVKFDWENYSPFVRNGGMVVFHDVDFEAAAKYGKTLPGARCAGFGAAIVLNEIEAAGRTYEMVPGSSVGTGVVRV